jgi:hypothetical protein
MIRDSDIGAGVGYVLNFCSFPLNFACVSGAVVIWN